MYMYEYEMHISVECKAFLSGRGSFLALSRVQGTRGGRVYTMARVLVTAGVNGACSGPQSRAI